MDPQGPEGTAAVRAILERVDIDAIARLMERGFRELPAYNRFVPLESTAQDRGLVAIRWNLALFQRWIAGGAPVSDDDLAELHELVRARAVEGMPIEDGLLIYRRGARIAWEAMLDLGTDTERAALLEHSGTVWHYLDLVSDVFARAYSDDNEVPASAGERRARALLDRLCAGVPLTVEDRERAERLEFDLTTSYEPFIAVLVGASMREHIELASRLRTAGQLAATEGPRIAGLAHPDFSWDPLLADNRFLVANETAGPSLPLGISIDTLRALTTLAATAGRRGRADVDEFLPHLLLHQSPNLADRLMERVYARLQQADNPDLVDTLKLLLANDFDRTATAAAIPIHRNTLLYRLNRIEELTGLDLERNNDRCLISLATLWATQPVRVA